MAHCFRKIGGLERWQCSWMLYSYAADMGSLPVVTWRSHGPGPNCA